MLFFLLMVASMMKLSSGWDATDVLDMPNDPNSLQRMVLSGANAAVSHVKTEAIAYTPLSDGAPVRDSVGAQQYNYYRFIAPVPFPRMDIVVVPIAGNPDLYMTAGMYW